MQFILFLLKAVAQVRIRESYVSNAIDAIVRNAGGVSREDRAFAELLATGVVATRGTLDEIIDRNLNSPRDIQPDVRDALRISAYELAFLGKSDYAVVDQGVELVFSVARPAVRLGNAVLRKIARDVKSFPWGDPATDDRIRAREAANMHKRQMPVILQAL